MEKFRAFLSDLRKSSVTALILLAIIGMFVYNNTSRLNNIEHAYCENGILVLQKQDQDLYMVLDSTNKPVTCKLKDEAQ
jgi:amino acid permease